MSRAPRKRALQLETKAQPAGQDFARLALDPATAHTTMEALHLRLCKLTRDFNHVVNVAQCFAALTDSSAEYRQQLNVALARVSELEKELLEQNQVYSEAIFRERQSNEQQAKHPDHHDRPRTAEQPVRG